MLLSLLIVPSALYGVVGLRIGSSTYQTWKLAATIQPLALVVVGALSVLGAEAVMARFLGSRVPSARIGRVLAVVPVIAAALLAMRVSQGTWDDTVASRATFRSRSVHPELVAAGTDPRVKAQPRLTVSLSPYFETMVAPVVADLHNVTFGVDTYRGPGAGADQCILTRAEPGALGGPGVVRVAGDLVLTPPSDCNLGRADAPP